MPRTHGDVFLRFCIVYPVLKGIENNQLITWNNTKTQENVSACTGPKPPTVEGKRAYTMNWKQLVWAGAANSSIQMERDSRLRERLIFSSYSSDMKMSQITRITPVVNLWHFRTEVHWTVYHDRRSKLFSKDNIWHLHSLSKIYLFSKGPYFRGKQLLFEGSYFRAGATFGGSYF